MNKQGNETQVQKVSLETTNVMVVGVNDKQKLPRVTDSVNKAIKSIFFIKENV